MAIGKYGVKGGRMSWVTARVTRRSVRTRRSEVAEIAADRDRICCGLISQTQMSSHWGFAGLDSLDNTAGVYLNGIYAHSANFRDTAYFTLALIMDTIASHTSQTCINSPIRTVV